MTDKHKCMWCDEQLYIKRVRIMMPILEAATPVYATINKLPFEYVGITTQYCPMCGRKQEEVQKNDI